MYRFDKDILLCHLLLSLLSLSLPSETPSSQNQSNPAGPAGVTDNLSIFYRKFQQDLSLSLK